MPAFESCVVLDGNQTTCGRCAPDAQFESCVVLDGNQTIEQYLRPIKSADDLRYFLY